MVAATIRRMASGTCSRRAGALSIGQSSLVASLTPPPGSAALLFARAARRGAYRTDVLASGMPQRHDRAANLVVAKAGSAPTSPVQGECHKRVHARLPTRYARSL